MIWGDLKPGDVITDAPFGEHTAAWLVVMVKPSDLHPDNVDFDTVELSSGQQDNFVRQSANNIAFHYRVLRGDKDMEGG